MAFISLLAAMTVVLLAASAVLFGGVLSIIIGTVLIHKTKYKKAGTALRIIGYIILIPAIVGILILIIPGIVSGG